MPHSIIETSKVMYNKGTAIKNWNPAFTCLSIIVDPMLEDVCVLDARKGLDTWTDFII
jgi:hypothetical protein